MSEYYTRRSANNEAKVTPFQQGPGAKYHNFVQSYTPAENSTVAESNVNSAGPLAANPEMSAVKAQPTLQATTLEIAPAVPGLSVMKVEPLDGVTDEQGAKLKNEHFQKWKEARKKAGFSAKVDKKLKKKRLNAKLEKVLKPKNAFLIFNELNLKPVYRIQENQKTPGSPKTYTAFLKLDNLTCIGEAANIAGAKMVAADIALKEWFVRLFKKSQPSGEEKMVVTESGDTNGTVVAEKEPAPWSTVGSYAMHLLFTRWQMDVNSLTAPESASTAMQCDTSTGSVTSVAAISSAPKLVSKAPRVVEQLVNYSAPPSPRFPPNPETCQPLYVFNFAFPNVPFVEAVNDENIDERFHMKCMINNNVYEAKARNKKDARKQIAIQVLKVYGHTYAQS